MLNKAKLRRAAVTAVEMVLCLAAIVVPSACVELLLTLCGFGK